MFTIVGIIQPMRLRGLVEPREMSRTGTYLHLAPPVSGSKPGRGGAH